MRHPSTRNANDVLASRLSPTERVCRKISDATGSPLTLALVIVLQFVWVLVGQMSHMDPFPFIFMLTVSNIIQLVLIVVLAVAGRQQAMHGEIRAEEDHAAISRVLYHQELQNEMLLDICAHAGIDVGAYSNYIDQLRFQKT